MTHSGTQYGDGGQQYEVTYFDSDTGKREVFGWTATYARAKKMEFSINLRPGWEKPKIEDRAASVDYEALLEKYLRYVAEAEGTDFIIDCKMRHASDVEFSEQEWGKLTKLSEKINDEDYND